MSLPLKYQAKLGTYKMELQGTPVNVRIAEHANTIDIGIQELKGKMGHCDVVGLAVGEYGRVCFFGKSTKPIFRISLVLCVQKYCLVVRFENPESFKSSLGEFLKDPRICFVGVNLSEDLDKLKHFHFETKHGIGLSELILRVLKKRPTSNKNSHLGSMVGLSLEESRMIGICRSEPAAFTHEDDRLLIHDTYSYFLIAEKLFGLL